MPISDKSFPEAPGTDGHVLLLDLFPELRNFFCGKLSGEGRSHLAVLAAAHVSSLLVIALSEEALLPGGELYMAGYSLGKHEEE